jgi:hypothetical protein
MPCAPAAEAQQAAAKAIVIDCSIDGLIPIVHASPTNRAMISSFERTGVFEAQNNSNCDVCSGHQNRNLRAAKRQAMLFEATAKIAPAVPPTLVATAQEVIG